MPPTCGTLESLLIALRNSAAHLLSASSTQHWFHSKGSCLEAVACQLAELDEPLQWKIVRYFGSDIQASKCTVKGCATPLQAQSRLVQALGRRLQLRCWRRQHPRDRVLGPGQDQPRLPADSSQGCRTCRAVMQEVPGRLVSHGQHRAPLASRCRALQHPAGGPSDINNL